MMELAFRRRGGEISSWPFDEKSWPATLHRKRLGEDSTSSTKSQTPLLAKYGVGPIPKVDAH